MGVIPAARQRRRAVAETPPVPWRRAVSGGEVGTGEGRWGKSRASHAVVPVVARVAI